MGVISLHQSLAPFLKRKPTIALVGMMGVGKSSVGWRLAKRLSLSFCDSDREVENAAGCRVPDIYALWGEAAFKEVEQKVIKRLLGSGNCVLSTGDGAFIQPLVRQQLLDNALCVWLKADLETIYQRVRHRTTRPQLLTEDPKATLASLMEERLPLYSQAHLVVESQDEAHDSTVERLLEGLVAYLENGVVQQ